MKRSLVDVLRCPSGCRELLEVGGDTDGDDYISNGSLHCPGCGAAYAIENGIARMLPRSLSSSEPPDGSREAALKRSEMAARDSQVGQYDRMIGLALFGKLEIPLTLRQLRPQPSDMLLEAGCGTGRMTGALADRCRTHVAVDFSLQSLLACKEKLSARGIGNTELLQADVCALPFRDGAFDRLVSCQVLEHVPTVESRRHMVKELARAARPGATLVISAYQHSTFTRLFGRREGMHEGGIYYYRFERRELRALLASVLEVQRITGALVYHYTARCRKARADIVGYRSDRPPENTPSPCQT